MEKKTASVDVSVKLSRNLADFLKALYGFSKVQGSFEEWLGSKIAQSVQADFTDNLESTLNMDQIIHSYGLDKIPEFKHDC